MSHRQRARALAVGLSDAVGHCRTNVGHCRSDVGLSDVGHCRTSVGHLAELCRSCRPGFDSDGVLLLSGTVGHCRTLSDAVGHCRTVGLSNCRSLSNTVGLLSDYCRSSVGALCPALPSLRQTLLDPPSHPLVTSLSYLCHSVLMSTLDMIATLTWKHS